MAPRAQAPITSGPYPGRPRGAGIILFSKVRGVDSLLKACW